MSSSNFINIGVRIDLTELLETRALILADSGSGKSWLIRKMAEECSGKVQQIIIDPEGDFVTLREKYPFALVSKHGGDLPLNVRYAEALAHKILETGLSVIVDLYELKKPERVAFVKAFTDALVDAPKKIRRSCIVYYDEAQMFCMDEETDILTSNGWKRYNEINIGDLAVGFDLIKNTYQYETVNRLIIKKHTGDMVSLKSKAIDCLVTPDHRVVLQTTQRAKGRTKSIYPHKFCKAIEVPTNIQIPNGGCPSGSGLNELSDELIRTIGWVITDGCFAGGNPTERYISISQSCSTIKNGVNISELMENLLVPMGASVYNRKERISLGKEGSIKVTKKSKEFYLGSVLSKEIMKHTGVCIHRIPRNILNHASVRQLQILLEGLMEGDGTASKGNRYKWDRLYAGKNEKLADDVQELCLRLGFRANKIYESSNKQFSVHVSNRGNIFIRKKTITEYSGIVWDITLQSGAFVARRKGKVFVTGNCPQDKSAESFGSIIDICTRGRKRGLCAVLATHRASIMNNDAMAQCKNKFMGSTSLPDDQKKVAHELGLYDKTEIRNLRNLGKGEFYTFGNAISKEILKFKVGAVKTTHIKSGGKLESAPPTPAIIKKILSKLEDIPEEAERELNTKNQLQAEVKRLTYELRKKPKVEPEIKNTSIVDVYKMKMELTSLRESLDVEKKLSSDLRGAFTNLSSVVETAKKTLEHKITLRTPPKEKKISFENGTLTVPKNSKEHIALMAHPQNASVKEDTTLSKSAKTFLQVLCMYYPELITRSRLSLFTGYKITSSNFASTLSQLRMKGYLTDGANGMVSATEEGFQCVGRFEPLPTSPSELRNYWSQKVSKSASTFFLYLFDKYPNYISREEISENTGYALSSSNFASTLSQLRVLGLIQDGADKTIRVHEDLFSNLGG